MIERVVAWATRRPWLVIAVAALLGAFGEVARRRLNRDAIPDLSDPQIVLVADWMGHPAVEVAEGVTRVLTRAFDGLPGMTAVRGSSMSGMAYVDVLFDSPSTLERGRQAIVDRVAGVRKRLPASVRLQIGPLASSTGWVFEYALVDPHRRQSGLALRRLQDDVLRPALASILGVSEVASVGGEVQEVLVEIEADRLRARGVAYTDVVSAVRSAIASAVDPKDLSSAPLDVPSAVVDAVPPRIGDFAHVRLADDMPTGLADFRGIQPAVGGIVVAARNADIVRVIAEVKRTLDRQRSTLPPGVELVTAYDRSELIAGVGQTMLRALGEEVAVVVLVTLLFLVHFRSALVPLVTLPVVLLLTFAGMYVVGAAATIMSLGGAGIALGMAVDADIVALEACHRRIEALGPDSSSAERRAALVAAAGSFAPAILTALVITGLTFL
ncbi:MAG: efflux RND transporter permease subunit, partial [Myxococcota bacterium]|nr:efflux RND transporter permease subunit [Myxococcota bacterium]